MNQIGLQLAANSDGRASNEEEQRGGGQKCRGGHLEAGGGSGLRGGHALQLTLPRQLSDASQAGHIRQQRPAPFLRKPATAQVGHRGKPALVTA